MPAEQDDGFMLDDRDRLPWLEPAEPVQEMEPVAARKIMLLVLVFLVLLALVVALGWWYKSRDARDDGEVTLIAAPGGPYKIPASEAAGKNYDVEGKAFPGKGYEAYATSEGGNAMGQIDPSKAPETPMTDMVAQTSVKPATPAPARPQPAKAAATGEARAAIRNGDAPRPSPSPTVAPPAAAATAAPEVPTGPQVQLGAYNNQTMAQEAWRGLVARFEELKGASHRIEPVVSGGKTLYRLRMGVSDNAAATTLCGRLRVAGESCWAVR